MPVYQYLQRHMSSGQSCLLLAMNMAKVGGPLSGVRVLTHIWTSQVHSLLHLLLYSPLQSSTNLVGYSYHMILRIRTPSEDDSPRPHGQSCGSRLGSPHWNLRCHDAMMITYGLLLWTIWIWLDITCRSYGFMMFNDVLWRFTPFYDWWLFLSLGSKNLRKQNVLMDLDDHQWWLMEWLMDTIGAYVLLKSSDHYTRFMIKGQICCTRKWEARSVSKLMQYKQYQAASSPARTSICSMRSLHREWASRKHQVTDPPAKSKWYDCSLKERSKGGEKMKLLYFVWSPPWHLYILLLANLLAFYLTYFLAFDLAFYLAYLLAFYLAYLLADVLAYLPADVLAYLLAYLLAYVLAYLLAFHLAFYLAYLLAYYLANLLAFHLAFYLAYLLAYYLANLLAFYLANILALYLAYLLAF